MPIPSGPAGPVLPSWAPGLSDVAQYVPQRTLVPTSGANNSEWTFDSTTRPTDVVVDGLIAKACAWTVLPLHHALDASLTQAAATVAAQHAAWAVEQAYPEREAKARDTATDTAAALLKEARQMRAELVIANDLAWDTDHGTVDTPYTGFDVVYSFPEPCLYGDLNL